MVPINYKSDFKLTESSETIVSNVPFTFTYYVTKKKKYIASFDGVSEYVNCERLEDGSIEVLFNNSNLGRGTLRVERKYYITDEDFKDGIFNVVTDEATDVFLHDGKTYSPDVRTTVVPPYIKGDKGDPMTWSTMTEEERAELVQNVAEAIDPEMVMPENEQIRQNNEQVREANERTREASELLRDEAFQGLKGEMQSAITAGNVAAGNAQKVVDEYDTKVAEQDSKLSQLGSKVYNTTFINISKWQTSLGDSLEDETWGYNPTTKKTYYKRNGELTSCEMDENILYKFGEDFYKWNGNDLIRYGIEYLINSIYNNEFLSWESAPSIKGMVASSGIAESNTSSYKVFKVKEGQNITFLGNASSQGFFVIVNSLSWFNTSTYDFAEGYSERAIIYANSEKSIVVPNGGKYLIVCHYYTDTDRTPQSFSIDGYDLIVGGRRNILEALKLKGEIQKESTRVNLYFINLSYMEASGLTGMLQDGEWGYNKTNKKVYFKREGKESLESFDMNSNTLYKFNDEFYKWNGTDLVSWDISLLRKLLTDSDGMSWEDYPSIGGTVNSTSVGSPTGGSHKVIGVKGGQKIVVKGSPNGANYYVFVKSIDFFNPTFDLVESVTGRITISSNATANIEVPSDAKYFVICHFYGDSDRTPQSLIIDDFDLIVGAKSYIANLNKSVSKLESDISNSGSVVKTKIVDWANTLTMWYFNTSAGVGGVATKMQSDTLGTVLVRIKQGDIIETNSELDSSSVRQWCVMKDDLTITKILPKFSEYTVTEQDILDGGTIMAIPCRVTQQVAPLYVRRTRNVVGRNEYDNKTIILLGDSQVGQCQGLEDVIEEKIGNRVINAGFGGCRWSWRTTSGTSDWDKFCAIGVADAIISGDFAPLYDAVDRLVESGSSVNYFKRALDGLSSLEFGNGENIILTIAYGGNDHSSSAPLGGDDSTDKETLYGAMNYVIDSLVKEFPMIDIRVLCPTYVAYSYEKDENNRKVVTEDSDVRKIGEYTRQQYAEFLLEHAKRKKVPTYDMYNRGGRNKDNIYILTPDGIHPNTELGVKHTANRYLRILDSF